MVGKNMINITDSNFIKEVEQSEIPVLVDFNATWCTPCKVLATTLEKMISSYPNIKFCSADVDKAHNSANRFGIRSVPTLILFKDGTRINTITGNVSSQIIAEMLTKI